MLPQGEFLHLLVALGTSMAAAVLYAISFVLPLVWWSDPRYIVPAVAAMLPPAISCCSAGLAAVFAELVQGEEYSQSWHRSCARTQCRERQFETCIPCQCASTNIARPAAQEHGRLRMCLTPCHYGQHHVAIWRHLICERHLTSAPEQVVSVWSRRWRVAPRAARRARRW